MGFMLQLTRAQMAQIEAAAIAQYPQECCGLLLGTLSSRAAPPKNLVSPLQTTNDSLKHTTLKHTTLKHTTEIWPTANAWPPEGLAEGSSEFGFLASPRQHGKGDRFWIAPQDLFKAQKFARSQNWQLIGVYHSHPDHPAVPSECDRQAAWPEYSYLILSVVAQSTAATVFESPLESPFESSFESPRVVSRQTWVLNPDNQFEPERLEIQDPASELA